MGSLKSPRSLICFDQIVRLLNVASDFRYFGRRLTELQLELPVYQNTRTGGIARQLTRDLSIPMRMVFGLSPDLRILCINIRLRCALDSKVLAAMPQRRNYKDYAIRAITIGHAEAA